MAASAELVILLLGDKRSGKSSVGNIILNTQAFHKKTNSSCKRTGTVFGRQVTVVDTPGWSSHSTTPHQVSEELHSDLTLCEPHVILLVLPTSSSFGQGEWRAMEAHLRQLDMPIWQRAMILFTHGDSLGGLSVEDHIRQQGSCLHWLLERCGNRYHMMSDQTGRSELQVKQLLRKIHTIIEANNYPKVIREEMYTKLRQEVSVRQEKRMQRKEEETEMTMMYDVYDGRVMQRQRMESVYREALAGQPTLKPILALILLGRRKSGKSSSGNVILDKEVFHVNTKTERCSAGHGVVCGQSVTVVDTPGWSLFGLANPQVVTKMISDSPSLCPVGSKVVFLLAVPVATFKEKDRRAVEEYLSVLGNTVWTKTMVLFTYGDELRSRTVTKHVEKQGDALRWVMDRCGERHHVFDTNIRDRTQVKQILEKVQQF